LILEQQFNGDQSEHVKNFQLLLHNLDSPPEC
jgi:hypothetical protein